MVKWRGCLFIVLRIPWLVQSCIQSSKFHLQTPAPFACRTAFLLSEWWWCLIRQGEGLPHVKYLAFVYPPKQEKGRMYSISMWNSGSACCCLLCTTKWSTTGYTLKKQTNKKKKVSSDNKICSVYWNLWSRNSYWKNTVEKKINTTLWGMKFNFVTPSWERSLGYLVVFGELWQNTMP